MLKIEHLRKHFGNRVVLDDVSLDLDKGQALSIIGQSGQGKSLILKHIIGLLIPDGGRIFIDGEEITSPTKKSSDFARVRKKLGMLFQGAALFDSKNVGENLAFPLREHTELSEEEIQKTIADALEMVGLHDIQEKMPAELSGGMRSRVGLARALVMKPQIMLYDEPTSALDPIMSDKINDLIIDLKQKLNMTSVIVTHDMASAYKISDKIAMIHEGKIIFSGTPAEIRASRNPYIQQFISGRRKLHYAVEAQPVEKVAYNRQVDINKLRRRADVAETLSRNKNPSFYDLSTGLLNLSRFKALLSQALDQARTSDLPFACAVASIDFYSELAERYGKEFGAAVLRGVATEIRNCIRGDSDVAASLSEDSFGILIMAPRPSASLDTLERIRSTVAEEPFETQNDEDVSITISIGVAILSQDDVDGDTLLSRAKQALAAAQHAGHNRIERAA